MQADVAMAKMVDGKIQEVFLQMFLQTKPLIKRIESTRLPSEPKLDPLFWGGSPVKKLKAIADHHAMQPCGSTNTVSKSGHPSKLYLYTYIHTHGYMYIYIHT